MHGGYLNTLLSHEQPILDLELEDAQKRAQVMLL